MFTIEVDGLKEIIAECEKLATPRELMKVDRKAIKECLDLAEKEVYKVIPVSENVAHSGRKGSRSYMHSRDWLHVEISRKKDSIVGTLQIANGKGDNSWFYSKFYEFAYGNSKYPPSQPFQKSFKKLYPVWEKIFLQEYDKLVEKLNK